MENLNLTTVVGWAVIATAGGLIYFVSNRNNKGRPPKVSKLTGKVPEKKEPKAKKGKAGGEDKAQQKKKAKQTPKVEQTEQSAPSTRATQEVSEDDNVREFAQQMANVKSGVISAPKANGASRQKSVKQNRAQEKAAETSSDYAPRSTTDGDADDDQSSISSAIFTTPAREGGVSDMLEKPTPGPSVLRVTEPTKPIAPKKAKSQPSFETAETKKQRQNRKKAEEKKAAREEEEKQRKVLENNQRRAAREAEGRAAKDGSAFMASQAPTKSAWTPATTSSNGVSSTTSSNGVQLLDTHEPAASKPTEPIYSEGQVAGSEWQKNLPSEEEQTRLALEDNDNWQQVTTKEKRNRGNKTVPKDNPSIKRSSSDEEKKDYGAPARTASTGPGQKWTSTLVHVEDGHVVERDVETQDSEWEVA